MMLIERIWRSTSRRANGTGGRDLKQRCFKGVSSGERTAEPLPRVILPIRRVLLPR